MIDHLIVSPHPDDAVWSLGGRIAAWRGAGATCTVLTVFDGPTAQPDGEDPGWRAIADPAIREPEDRAALAVLDCRRVSLGLPDAALRTRRTAEGLRHRYSHPRRLFAQIHSDDLRLLDTLIASLRPHIATATVVHAPLGAGRHVDHRLVRLAIESLQPNHTHWYEEFPYPLHDDDHSGLNARVEPLDIAHLQAWIHAAQHYPSQVDVLCGGPEGLRDAVHERCARHGRVSGSPWADRYWVGRPSRTASHAKQCSEMNPERTTAAQRRDPSDRHARITQ